MPPGQVQGLLIIHQTFAFLQPFNSPSHDGIPPFLTRQLTSIEALELILTPSDNGLKAWFWEN